MGRLGLVQPATQVGPFGFGAGQFERVLYLLRDVDVHRRGARDQEGRAGAVLSDGPFTADEIEDLARLAPVNVPVVVRLLVFPLLKSQ